MKIAAIVARLLLGLIFAFFGLNGFLHFLPIPPMHGAPAQYMAGLAVAHLFPVVALIQVICGVLFLAGLFVPLAMVLIGPIIANILIYHLALDPAGIGPGLLTFVLWLFLFFYLRPHFDGIFTARS